MHGRMLDLLVPRGLAPRTGGYIYDRRVVEGLGSRGWKVQVHALDASFPAPSTQALREAAHILAGIPDGRCVVIDGLALGGMPELAEAEGRRLRLIGLIHHPLALETGLDPEKAARLRATETRALAATRLVIVTSATTARVLLQYGVPQVRIAVANPGTDPAPPAAGSDGSGLELLCVATLTPRKGHALLLEALAGLRHRPWRLTCAGSDTCHPETAQALRRQISSLGLEDRVILTGELDDDALGELYHRADAFVLASHYEGYGMAFDEALARGLPIVGTRAGAIPETVPPTAGLLVPPGDADALAGALRRLLDDPELRSRLQTGARVARGQLRSWADTCSAFAGALARVAAP